MEEIAQRPHIGQRQLAPQVDQRQGSWLDRHFGDVIRGILLIVALMVLGALTATGVCLFFTARASLSFRVLFAVGAVVFPYYMVRVLYECVRTRLGTKPYPDGLWTHLID